MCQFFFADVVFSTAHRSKGLEFDTVIIADDFRTDFKQPQFGRMCDRVEQRLHNFVAHEHTTMPGYLILNEENENCK